MKNQDMQPSYASDRSSIVETNTETRDKDYVEIQTVVRFPNGEALRVNARLDTVDLMRANDRDLSVARHLIETAIKTQCEEVCRIVRSLALWRFLRVH